MKDSEEPIPPEDVPGTLITGIDSLDVSGLKAVRSYVEQRIDYIRQPIAEAITADRDGEIIEIEDHGGYALVQMHPPAPDGSGVDRDRVSFYHVRRKVETDGTETLRWAFLGDVQQETPPRCDSCGRPLNEDDAACPHCDSTEPDQSEGEN